AVLGLAGLAAAGFFTGACLLTAVFLPFAASLTGAGASAAAPDAASAPLPPALPLFLALPAAAVLAPNLPPLRPHLPRSGAAASSALHSSKVRLLGSLSLGILALRALSVM